MQGDWEKVQPLVDSSCWPDNTLRDQAYFTKQKNIMISNSKSIRTAKQDMEEVTCSHIKF
jgi:hypothetical protein